LDLRRVKVVVQYKVPKSPDTLVQRFGQAAQDQSINAVAILLAEKGYFSKKRWAQKREEYKRLFD